jgi:hypothetical protein
MAIGVVCGTRYQTYPVSCEHARLFEIPPRVRTAVRRRQALGRLEQRRQSLSTRRLVLAPSATNNGMTGRANVVSNVDPYAGQQTIAQWFNPAAFSIPPASCYCYGNAGREVLTGPRSANLDLTAAKRFRITESTNLAFRAEFFDALNHPQFAIPGNTTIGSNEVGSITATSRPRY